MEIVILLIPLALILVALAVWAFVWALKRDQFEDMDSPAWRILFEDRNRRRDDHD